MNSKQPKKGSLTIYNQIHWRDIFDFDTMATPNRDESLKYASRTSQQCCELLNTHPEHGLSFEEVELRQHKYKKNELDMEPKESLMHKFMEQFQDPLIMLLLGSALLSLLVGQVNDAISIAITVLIVLTGIIH